MPDDAADRLSAPPAKAKAEKKSSAPEFTFMLATATAPGRVVPEKGLDQPALFFNRELSWLDFNRRVLHQAIDERTPLLERVHFLTITANNLDEFFRKRVGGLKRQAAAGVRKLSPDGRTPEEQLQAIGRAVRPMYREMTAVWQQHLVPQLAGEADIHVRDYEDLSRKEKQHLREFFKAKIFPVLTPLAVDPGHPFPFISNLSLSLAVILQHPERGTEHFARVKVPSNQQRFVELEAPGHFVPIEQVIAHNADDLFRGMDLKGVYPFRITRNADIRRDEEEADDLIEMISDELRERRFSSVVRLEVEGSLPAEVKQLLMRELSLGPEDVYETKGLIDYRDGEELYDLGKPALKYPPWKPVVSTPFLHKGESKRRESIFSLMRREDILVHHPYESFRSSVQRFIEEAADDPRVMAIKQTLYRTSEQSPIVAALMRAAEKGKQVAVLVEVKARFDEKNNIEWGQMLEKSGVHVTYGLVGLKTHAKVTLVIREEEQLRTYCHLGTGNYNPTTARLYTDLGLFTCRPDLGGDLTNLFHYLTGYAPEQHYKRLVVAPSTMRETFTRRIQKEVDHQQSKGNGRIIAKMNALDDESMIRELYRASQAGVQVDLIVRGHCRLRPGLEGFSENIRVISIIGRFLEHSRIYYFHNDEDPKVFIGSADWQRRNLEDRVETVVEVEGPRHRARLTWILEAALSDRQMAWDLHADGQSVQRQPRSAEEEEGFQELLMRCAVEQTTKADPPWES